MYACIYFFFFFFKWTILGAIAHKYYNNSLYEEIVVLVQCLYQDVLLAYVVFQPSVCMLRWVIVVTLLFCHSAWDIEMADFLSRSKPKV